MKHLLVSGILLTGACAPLEQAPLVYSSKNQIGVNVSAGTPDSPGLDLSVGYKGLDAAYVPVAVSKACPAQTDCPDNFGRIDIIQGGNKQAGQESVDDQELANAEQAVDLLDDRVQAQSTRVAKLKEASLKLEELDQQDKSAAPADASEADANAFAANRQARMDALKSQIQELTGLEPDQIKDQLAADERALSDSRVALSVKSAELAALRASRKSQSMDDKSDALSVYGSFDGNAGGSSSSATISLGKVFSTGIAAQNLTQGLADGAEIAQRSLCIEQLRLAAAKIGGTGETELLKQAKAICAVRASGP